MATAMRATAVALLAATTMALPQVRQLQTQAAPFRLDTNGAQVDGEIAVAAQQSWFIFTAQGGASYQIQTIIGTLDDTVMDLVDTDGSTQLAENDDDARDPNSYASFLEWSCPHDGDYYILVKGYGRATGTFTVSVTQVGGGMGGVGGGDPCNGGEIIDNPSGSISFMPDGNYGDNAACMWSIQCANGQPPELTFTDFDTEANFDFVTLHEGEGVTDATIGAPMSGGMADLPNRVFNGVYTHPVIHSLQSVAGTLRAPHFSLMTKRCLVPTCSAWLGYDHRVCHGRQRHGRRLCCQLPLRRAGPAAAPAAPAAPAPAAPPAAAYGRPRGTQRAGAGHAAARHGLPYAGRNLDGQRPCLVLVRGAVAADLCHRGHAGHSFGLRSRRC
jgi:hypothetical protein